MENSEKDPIKWYVLSTIFRRELKVQDDMRHYGIECYIPMTYEVRMRRGRKQRLLMPAVRNLIFAHDTEEGLKEYIKGTREVIYFRKRINGNQREPMSVSDHEMENFIRLTEHVEQNMIYFAPGEIKFHVGDKIKIHGGVFDGVEGILVRLPGKRSKSLVVSIPSVMDVAVTLQPEVIELISNTGEPEKKPSVNVKEQKRKAKTQVNIEEDSKQLFTLAYKKLFACPDKQSHENEYNILMSEMRQLYDLLILRKGYIAQQEGLLSLALYLASIALSKDTEKATKRMEAAMTKLKGTSMLKLRLQMYYALYHPDTELLQQVKQEVASWNRLKASLQQQKILEEIKLIDEMKTK